MSVRTTLAWNAVWGLVAALGWGASALAGEAVVAVAANFAAPLARIGEGFTAATGHTLKISSGPTGKFHSQVAMGGAPFEVLIAADEETPAKLLAEGHAVAGTRFTYAVGQLVLWSANPSLVDAAGAVLASDRYARIAIANPKVAPYGRAALEVIAARRLEAIVRPRIVTGESVAQAFQFVASGNAEIGFVALSQVTVPGKPAAGSMWRVPGTLHGEIRQDAVLLKAGEKSAAARSLLEYLKGAPAKAIIESFGYLR